MVPDRWEAIGKGSEDGQPVVYVAREKTDRASRLTVWKLMRREGVWYSVGQWISKGVYRTFPEGPRGVRLSDSKTDQALLHYANEAIA